MLPVAAAPTAAGQPATATAGQLDAAASQVGAVLASATALANLLEGDHVGPVFAAFTPDVLQRFTSDVGTARTTAEQEHAALRGAADGARNREAEAVRRAEAEAEAARRAEAEAAAARAAEERRRSERSRAESSHSAGGAGDSGRAAVRRPQPAPAPAAEPDPPAPSGGGNPYPGYTGPRCYDPGGVTWRPCPERG